MNKQPDPVPYNWDSENLNFTTKNIILNDDVVKRQLYLKMPNSAAISLETIQANKALFAPVKRNNQKMTPASMPPVSFIPPSYLQKAVNTIMDELESEPKLKSFEGRVFGRMTVQE